MLITRMAQVAGSLRRAVTTYTLKGHTRSFQITDIHPMCKDNVGQDDSGAKKKREVAGKRILHCIASLRIHKPNAI